MNMSCSSRMIKYLMFAFNLFFVISGIIIIAVGATVKTVYSDYTDFLDSKYFTLPNMLIATGALIFFISFFGCCGAVRESWVMLGVFCILLSIIFIFEFSAGIAGYVLRDKTIDYLDTTLKENLKTYTTSTNVSWDSIQRGFQCCGVDSYKDWSGVFADPYALPVSCCPAVSGSVGTFYCNAYTPSDGTTPPTTVPNNSSSVTTQNVTVSTKPTEPPSTTPTASPTTETTTTVTTDTTVTTSVVTTLAPSSSKRPASVENTPNGVRRKRALNDDAPGAETTVPPTTTPNASSSEPYPTGCKTAFGQYVKKHAVQIGGCALGLAIIQILGIAFSCHLVRQLKNGYYST